MGRSLILENITTLLERYSTEISLGAAVISTIALIISLVYNAHQYRLAYEQDLLIRKERHFNELKERVIEPLLYEDKRANFSSYFFVDMIRYHYPELGRRIKQLAIKYREYENLKKEIINACLAIINEKGNKESIKFSIHERRLEEKLSSIVRILRCRHPIDYEKERYVLIDLVRDGDKTYHALYLIST